jgi:hypothetical protein
VLFRSIGFKKFTAGGSWKYLGNDCRNGQILSEIEFKSAFQPIRTVFSSSVGLVGGKSLTRCISEYHSSVFSRVICANFVLDSRVGYDSWPVFFQ